MLNDGFGLVLCAPRMGIAQQVAPQRELAQPRALGHARDNGDNGMCSSSDYPQQTLSTFSVVKHQGSTVPGSRMSTWTVDHAR